jgi:hypothetical protein
MRQTASWWQRHHLLVQDGAVLAGVLLLSNILLWFHHTQVIQSPQALANINFSQAASLAQAIEAYPKVWPPLYPITLYGAAWPGIAVGWVNHVYLSGIMLWLFLWTRHLAIRRTYQYPFLGLFALAGFHYENASFITSEMLFTLLSLLFFGAIYRYMRQPVRSLLVTAAMYAGAACITRYFSLFWLVPLGVVLIWLATPAKHARLLYPAIFALCALLPISLWMGYVYTQTGTLSGQDRFAERALPADIAYWSELTDLEDNIVLTARTFWIDFFSFSDGATHEVVNTATTLAIEGYLALLLCLAFVVVLAHRFSPADILSAGRQKQRPVRERLRDGLQQPVPLFLLFFALYILALMILWTIGNNDPIYSRFVYPSYPYLCLAMLLVVCNVLRPPVPRWYTTVIVALIVLLVFVHAARSTEPLRDAVISYQTVS